MRFYVIRSSTRTVHRLNADNEAQAVALAQAGHGLVEETNTAPAASEEPETAPAWLEGLSEDELAALPPIARMTSAQLNAIGESMVKNSTKETLKYWW